MRFPSKVSIAMSSLSMLRGLFLFCCLLFASCVEHKDEKGDGSRPWKESRKFLLSDYVGGGDLCVQWSDWFKCKGSKLTKSPDTLHWVILFPVEDHDL